MKKAFAGPVAVYRNRTGDCRMLLDRAVLHHSGRLLGSAGCTDEEGAFQGEIRETADNYEGFPVGANGLALNRPIRLAKNEWQRVLTAGDPVLSVHIPAGMSLAHEVCEASYARARIIFAAHFPEFAFKAFYCESWMMDPQLAALLGQETNITRFQNKYWPYPTRSQGRAVADFVFLKDWAAGIADWPEDTRLRSAIKNHYLAGRFVYESGGVFF